MWCFLTGDQPKALGPHLDYHPNATARLQFHEEFGPPIWFTNQSEANILMGNSDEHESLEFKVLLGVWKPLNHNPICDFPLAVMDARTIDPSDICLVKNTINFLWMFKFKNLAGGIAFNPDISRLYICYQIMMMVGTVIGPGTIFLMLVGAFNAGKSGLIVGHEQPISDGPS